ncbi:MAG: hypothetical protein ACOC9Y_05315, partial [Chloroflexota bacterium]
MTRRFPNFRGRMPAAIIICLATVLAVGLAVSAEEPANEDFQETWERTDRPIVDLETQRTWIWGSEAITDGLTEEYAEAENGERTVQYFDKSRMEIPVGVDTDVEG